VGLPNTAPEPAPAPASTLAPVPYRPQRVSGSSADPLAPLAAVLHKLSVGSRPTFRRFSAASTSVSPTLSAGTPVSSSSQDVSDGKAPASQTPTLMGLTVQSASLRTRKPSMSEQMAFPVSDMVPEWGRTPLEVRCKHCNNMDKTALDYLIESDQHSFMLLLCMCG